MHCIICNKHLLKPSIEFINTWSGTYAYTIQYLPNGFCVILSFSFVHFFTLPLYVWVSMWVNGVHYSPHSFSHPQLLATAHTQTVRCKDRDRKKTEIFFFQIRRAPTEYEHALCWARAPFICLLHCVALRVSLMARCGPRGVQPL